MKILTREEFLNPTELKTKEVPTPELGEGTGVRLRELGADGRMALLSEYGEGVELDGPKAVDLRAKILLHSVIGEDGELLCRDDGDLKRILKHDLDLIVRLGDVAMELSGIGPADEDEAEDAVKNSESGD